MGKSCSNYSQGGGNIGRITIEFNEQDKESVDRLMCAVGHSPIPKELWLDSDEMLSLSEFEIRLYDTSELEAERIQLQEEMNIVAEMIQ